MERTKKLLNKILNSKAFVIIIGIIIILKTIIFYANTININRPMQFQTIVGTIALITSLICFVIVISNRTRVVTIMTIDTILSLLLVVDNLYYAYSSNVITVTQISNLQYTEQIIDTLPSLIKPVHALYFLDIILIFILWITRILKLEKSPKNTRKQDCINALEVIIGITIFALIGNNFVQKGTEKSWNREEQIEETTIYGYHLFDIINSINYKNRAVYLTYEEMIKEYNSIKEEYQTNYGEIKYDFEGMLEGQNVLVVQLESVQEFVVGKKINGKEITPNLNEFLNQNIEFTNMHMQSYSSTADSEYTLVTSTYPMENGMSYSKYFTNTYNTIFDLFNNKGYYTSYMHGNISRFWNRENVYSRMNLNQMIFLYDYEDRSELICNYLSDELFYKQSVEKLKQQESPFMTLMVAASSHTPFELEGIENKEEKVTIDVGKYKGTYFGNYLEAVNYVDYAFGILINELKLAGIYDNTALIVYGDHNGIEMWNDELQEFLEENKKDVVQMDRRLAFTRVLCGMKFPGVTRHIKIDKVINKLDLKPTLAYLCNLEDEFSLGTNIFASKDFVCLNNEKIITNEYYFEQDWYRIDNGEQINLDEIPVEEKEKLEKYYEYMKKELDISFSVNIHDLLK